MKTLLCGLLTSAMLLTPALLAPALAHEGHDHAKDASAAAHDCDEMMAHEAWARATLPRAPVGGAYVTLMNHGDTDDRLTGVTAPVGKEVQIHEMTEKDGVMSMRQIIGGLEVKAGETVTLAPGGLHLMILGLEAPLVEGEKVEMVLHFEKAGDIPTTFEIRAINARPGEAADPHAGHGEGHGAGMKH